MLEQLNQEQKDSLLKALLLFAVNGKGKVQLSEKFVKYAGEAFDLTMDSDFEEVVEGYDVVYTFDLKEEYKK